MEELKKREEPGLARLRDSVIEQLTNQYSLERITMEDFERRVEAANASSTRAGLESLIADLPSLPVAGRKESAAPVAYRVNNGIVPDQDTAICIFSGTERRGVWTAPRHFSSLNVFGGSKIDFRDAELPPDGLTVDVLCVFGGTELIVPEGVNVAVQGIGIFGGFSKNINDRRYPDAPLIRVRGLAVFGGADVKMRPSCASPRSGGHHRQKEVGYRDGDDYR